MTNPRDLVPSPQLPSSNAPPLTNPWLVAGWPGIGGVAAISTTYLVSVLGAKPMGMVPERDFFAVNHVEVQAGIARTGRLPRSMFFLWRDPAGRRDLIIFVGEAQPERNGYQLCQKVIEVAQAHGVERVVSFAAMASALRPDSEPRVFGAVTVPALLEEMRHGGVELLREGQIGGLNGALLAAAAERSIPALCLLGEMPFFAAGAPNPKAALATLGAFERLSGISVDTRALEHQAEQMQGQLEQLFDQLQRHQALFQGQNPTPADDGEPDEADGAAQEEGAAEESRGEAPDATAAPSARKAPRPADESTRRHIEELFTRAAADRGEAFTLKAELDRLGLFETYENRFLDLFRKAE
jgi:hypothetical protein